MKIQFIIPFTLFIIYSCSNAQTKWNNFLLEPFDFSKKINETTSAIIIDVRTPEEYSQGHLPNAKNVDWNGNDFEKQISLLDPSQPIFVYCLSGGRSAAATVQMRSMGFPSVYELNGGILKWRKEGLTETTASANKSVGMNKQQFDSLISSDQIVLIDFYADWCAPCKKMKPDLDTIETDLKGKVILFRIDAEENQILFKELNLETLPTLLLYKNKALVWSHTGYTSKAEIINQLK